MEYTILILLLPFLSFLTLGLGGKWMSHRTAGLIGTVVLGAVAVLSYVTAVSYFGMPRLADGTYETLIPYDFAWLPFTERLCIGMGILLDPISVVMLLVISTVSLMVHIYSFGYMKGERGFQRYYAFLSLFTMSMLGLVGLRRRPSSSPALPTWASWWASLSTATTPAPTPLNRTR